MLYHNVIAARFVARPNRFIAHVDIDGCLHHAHVKNTGRCRELLVPGAVVWLTRHDDPNRKTAYSLIAVEKNGRLINMDSQAPNKVVEEALQNGLLLPGMTQSADSVRREVRVEDSRLDFFVTAQDKAYYVEVKGVTLEENSVVLFPDAPTERGVKHLHTLCRLREQGFECCVLFVVQMTDALYFTPNNTTHPAFGAALKEAAAQGVHCCAWDCTVTPESLTLHQSVAIKL